MPTLPLLLLASVVGVTSIAPVGAGNALTLPAHRHMVRIDTGDGRPRTYLLAVQQNTGNRGLGFYRSDDEARTWRYYQPIQDDRSHTDRADLVVVGRDLALVYSYEGSKLFGSARHDVYFQWWRYSQGDWTPEHPVRVFDAESDSEAYSRGELAVDSRGRLWVQAFRLESGGRSTAVLAVSEDGGKSFRQLPPLATVEDRGGGRLLHLGTQLLFVYDSHAYATPARMRLHQDSDAPEQWTAEQEAFEDGIYHGAALSAVADGAGGMHLVYKDKDDRLFHRRFDGARFGGRLLIEEEGDWALQNATTLVGDELFVFYNRANVLNADYELRLRVLRGGVLTASQVLDGSDNFKGYLAAPASLPVTVSSVPCAYGSTPDASTGGVAALVLAERTPQEPPPGSAQDAGVAGDAGSPVVDAGAWAPDAGGGAPDAGGTPDAGVGPVDAGGPPVGGGNPAVGQWELLFADDFNRSGSGLGPDWGLTGLWRNAYDGALSDLHGTDQAVASLAQCTECRVDSELVSFGASEAGVFARARPSEPLDRYDLVLLSSGALRLRRHLGGATTVLGEAPSGLASFSERATVSLTVTGHSPVSLTASVNGAVKLVAVDSSPSRLTQQGSAGLWTLRAGVFFDAFRLFGGRVVAVPPGDGGVGGDGGGGSDAGQAEDAGVPPTGGGERLALTVTYTSNAYEVLGVDDEGTAYATRTSESPYRVYASTDARTWTLRGVHPGRAYFRRMQVLSDGTLLANVHRGGVNRLSRSTDRGATWTDVLTLGDYRMLTRNSIQELGGEVFFAEYQSFTGGSTPIRLHASSDGGRTWGVRHTFDGHRHAHGLRADPSTGALWVYFGDTTAQTATLRSFDQGRTWTTMVTGQQGNIVDAVPLPGGGLLFGQDISYLPPKPGIARLDADGNLTVHRLISGPAYSTFQIPSGGYLVGAAREANGDIYETGEVSARVYGSLEGEAWEELLTYPRRGSSESARADVYWALPSGELILELRNVEPLSGGDSGYQLLRATRR